MQLTSFTDYGLRSLIFLASLPHGQRTSIQVVSDTFKVPKNHLIKIINKLTQLGYIKAVRGKNGGINLAIPASDINVGVVVRELEPLQLVNCSQESCHITSACRLKLHIARAKEAFLSQLEQCTIQDLLKENDDLILLLTPVSS